MRKYPKYKPSGVEWIGDIPEHWEYKPIKRLSVVKRGASPRPIDDPKFFDDNGEYAWVRIADLTASERYLISTTQQLSILGSSLSVMREPGDFFLSIAGTVGKPIITKIKCCIHDGFVWFPNLKIDPEYLFYLFSTGLPYQGLGKWGTQLNLNTETVGEIVIPVPSNSVINSITSYLDQKTTQIDTLISQKQRLIELLKEERTAIINQAVTKGIHPKVKMKPSGIEWLGEIPAHWEVKKLKYVAAINPEVLKENENPNLELSYIDISSVDSSGIIVNISKQLFSEAPSRARRITKKGDTIISTVRTYLKAIAYIDLDIKDLICSTGFAIIRPTLLINSHFLFYLSRSDYIIGRIISLSKGVSYPAIDSADLKCILIPIPTLVEQEIIAKFLSEKNNQIEITINRIEKEITLLQEYRTALISEVVTGKVKVC